MLKISSASWHYRLYEWAWDENPPKNLCSYFWHIIFAFLLVPLILLGRLVNKIGGAKWLARGLFALLAGWFLFVLITMIIESWWNLLIIPALLGLAAIIVVITVVGLALWERRKKKAESAGSVSTIDLTISYIKAKKSRVCPLIEVITPEETKQ